MPLILLSEPPLSASSTSAQPPSSTSTSGLVTTMARCASNGYHTKTTEDEGSARRLRYSMATIDEDCIGDVMASRLVTCLLAHVLYLKSQVPFPMAQLSRMSPSRKHDARTDRKQASLLASFDTLSSHLGSTFSALSAALSVRKSQRAFDSNNNVEEDGCSDIGLAHLAILIGPSATSVSAARSRVVLEIDGLQLQAPHTTTPSRAHDEEPPNGKENIHGVISPEAVEDMASNFAQRVVLSEKSHNADDSQTRSDETKVEDSQDNANPASELEESEDTSSDASSNVCSDEDSSGDNSESEDEDADDQGEYKASLLAAERLLSRTLAMANSVPELGMAADISPTQTHILLRAPRRFNHPAWIPRPNITRDMDAALYEFEEEYVDDVGASNTEGLTDITNIVVPQRNARAVGQKAMLKKRGPKTDCVRVRCSATSARSRGNERGRKENCVDEEDSKSNEDNEMIWWSWDGRMEGFSW